MANTLTIASGAASTEAFERKARKIHGILLPAAVTGTVFTFLGSPDGTTYGAVYNGDGVAYQIAVSASRYVPLDWNDFQMKFLKVQSGLHGATVNQSQETILTLDLEGAWERS